MDCKLVLVRTYGDYEIVRMYFRSMPVQKQFISNKSKRLFEDFWKRTDAHGRATDPRYVPSEETMLALESPCLINCI